MSSTEVVLSPTKKTKQKMEQQQIVSNDVTNGCSDIVDGNNSISDESVNQQALINNNINDTNNKDCHVDVCMEPLLIQDCVDDQFDATNPINETNSVPSDTSDSPNDPISVCDILSRNNIIDDEDDPETTDSGGGGFMKTNLSLNLSNNEDILSGKDDDEKLANLPKNKKFLDSTDDQIMNQIFFQTITVTPTTDEDILLASSKYLSNDNMPLTPSEIDSDLIVGPVDFFNRKIDEDEAFDTTYTDTIDNYQENEDGNLCSLNDNFNDNYCSFSSIDYNTTNIQLAQENVNVNNNSNGEDDDDDRTPENDLLQPDTFLGGYAEQMRKQRPSIVIDCYDSDSKTEEEDENVVIGDEKINDYCFYFDQTIEEDDDDACYNINDVAETTAHVEGKEEIENDIPNVEHEASNENNNGKALDVQGEEDDKDECFETESEDDEEEDDEDGPNDNDKSTASDDEGVINESCLSVNVSGCN